MKVVDFLSRSFDYRYPVSTMAAKLQSYYVFKCFIQNLNVYTSIVIFLIYLLLHFCIYYRVFVFLSRAVSVIGLLAFDAVIK